MPRMMIPVPLIIATDVVGIGVLMPVVSTLMKTFHVTPFWVAVLVASFPAAQGIAGLALGRLGDTVPKKTIILACLVLGIFSYLAFSLVQSFLALVVSRICMGIASGSMAVVQSYMSERVEETSRMRYFSYLNIASSSGFLAGLLLIIVCDAAVPGSESYKIGARCCAGLFLLSFVLAAIFLDKARVRDGDAGTRPARLSLRPVLPILALYAITNLIFMQLATIFPLVAVTMFDFSAFGIGTVFVAMALLIAAAQLLLVPKLGERSTPAVVSGLFGLYGLGLLAFAGSAGVAIAIAGFLIAAIAYALLVPLLLSTLSQTVAISQQGVAMGSATAAATLGAVFGPLAGGTLLDVGGVWGPVAEMLLIAAASAIAAGMMISSPPSRSVITQQEFQA